MFLITIAFLLGDLFLQTFTRLPSLHFIFLISFLIIFLLYYLRYQYTYLIYAFLFGFIWTAWCAHSLLSWSLPKNFEGKSILVNGYIQSIPNTDAWQTNFNFLLDAINHEDYKLNKKVLVKLTWRNNNHSLKVGDKWQLLVRLKRIHTSQNPGSFDYEAWALQKGLRATGYVVSSSEKNILIDHYWYFYPINQIRQLLAKNIKAHLPNSNTSHWLLALTIGQRTGIEANDWRILRRTGTNHLMAIAGLHIGIIATIVHYCFAYLWRRIPKLMLWLPASQASACAALGAAFLYSGLAGFSIPTQRACLMLTVFIATLLIRRQVQSWQSWSVALLLILLINPLSVLTESFWLSFGTIALIIFGMQGRIAPNGVWWKWGRVQWVIGVGLIPMSLYFFGECSLVSFIANCVAVPWLAFFILPFCFLSAVFILFLPKLAEVLLLTADKSLSLLWMCLTWLSDLSFSTWNQVMPNYTILVITIIAYLIFLLPSGFPGRWLSIVWMLPLIFYQFPKPNMGTYWLTMLDVGQGLAIVVQTHSHILVYDTGPKYHDNFDLGEQVVVPFLKTINTKKIDMLIVSHADNDHSGGAQALISTFSVLNIRASVPEKIISSHVQLCLSGEKWQWDGVNFEFIYPSRDFLKLGNDSSCVLRIDNGQTKILLTGDIEHFAEKILINHSYDKLSADILQAPHHGSKTSGLNNFIEAVHPKVVLYSVGYRNRYHFPHASIVKSYSEINAQQFSTSDSGSIQIKMGQTKESLNVFLYRKAHRKYWYNE